MTRNRSAVMETMMKEDTDIQVVESEWTSLQPKLPNGSTSYSRSSITNCNGMMIEPKISGYNIELYNIDA